MRVFSVRLVVLACFTSALAGCSGFGSEQQSSTRITLMPDPTPGSTQTAVDLAPGATAPGIVVATEALELSGTPSPTGPAILPPVPVISTGGLGMTRVAWEEIHGTSISPAGHAPWYENYHYQVTFDERGLIIAIRAEYEDHQAASLQAARAEAEKLLPEDAVPGMHFEHGTMDPNTPGISIDPHVWVQLYESRSLRTTFPVEAFFGLPPGTCSIQYEQYKSLDGRVKAYLVELATEP